MEYPSLDKPTAGALRFNTDTGLLEVYAADEWHNLQGTSPEMQTGGTRALGCNGNEGPGAGTNRTNRIEYINISTTGNGVDFGDTTERLRAGPMSLASRTRAVMGGGQNPGYSGTLNYVTIASEGNGIDFGDLQNGGRQFVGGSNETRGIVWGQGAPTINIIQYITIAHAGNANDFGDLPQTTASGSSYGDKTRSLYAGGYATTGVQYLNIASTGNSSDFGDIWCANRVYVTAGCSNATRGLMMAGNQMAPNAGVRVAEIAYNTISTLGDQKDFGDLSAARSSNGCASSSTRGICMGGYKEPSGDRTDDIEYVEIATTGHAADFGNLTTDRTLTGCSNGHGGL